MTHQAGQPRVSIVGGGLAGLAAAVALAERGYACELFEARRQFGGRASSFTDPQSGEVIDNCQHVSLGCCTNLADFSRRTGIDRHFRRERELWFVTPDGRRFRFAATRGLPAPLHLAPALMRLGFLSWGERIGVARAMMKLAWYRPVITWPPLNTEPTMAHWLRKHRQSDRAIRRYWEPVLLSALAESLDLMTVAAARKVFVDGFMRHSGAYETLVPLVPLGELYGRELQPWFERQGVRLHLGRAVESVEVDNGRAVALRFQDGESTAVERAVVAVPWRRVAGMFSEQTRRNWPQLENATALESAPITGVHLWFDRPIMNLPQAVLLDTLSQWVFHHPWPDESQGHYYQVVISASRMLDGRKKDEIISQVERELRSAFPASVQPRLLRARVVTDPHAVFSPRWDSERLRLVQQTPLANLALAGDWTATGWPATMEGAVRSGYLAAEAILAQDGKAERVVVDDLPMARLTKWLSGG